MAAEKGGKAKKIDVKTPAGKTEGSVDLPAELFDAPANIALLHQVVTRPRPAARFAAVAASHTDRRAPVAPGRVRRARRSSPAVASCTVLRLATTASALLKR